MHTSSVRAKVPPLCRIVIFEVPRSIKWVNNATLFSPRSPRVGVKTSRLFVGEPWNRNLLTPCTKGTQRIGKKNYKTCCFTLLKNQKVLNMFQKIQKISWEYLGFGVPANLISTLREKRYRRKYLDLQAFVFWKRSRMNELGDIYSRHSM